MSTISPAAPVHLRDAAVLDQVLVGLGGLTDRHTVVKVDTATELATAQQVLQTKLVIGRHRSEVAQQFNPINVLRALGYSATLVTTFGFFYAVLEMTKK